jgi:hypothetical protein
LRTGRVRTPVTERDPFSGLVYADLADPVRYQVGVIRCGVGRPDPVHHGRGPSPWTPAQRETIHVLEGEVIIEIAGGPALKLKPGDLASLPAALETVWHITPPFTELWVLA